MIGWLDVDDGTAHLFGARFSGALAGLPTSRRRFRERGAPLQALTLVHRVNGRSRGDPWHRICRNCSSWSLRQ